MAQSKEKEEAHLQEYLKVNMNLNGHPGPGWGLILPTSPHQFTAVRQLQ